MPLPQLALHADQRAELVEAFASTFASVQKYFDVVDAKNDDAMEVARSIETSLAGVLHSSDTDCEYYPCILSGPEPTSDAFFASLGVTRDARCTMSGWDNPKLEVIRAGTGVGERSAFGLLTRLGDYEVEHWDEYVTNEEKVLLDAAIAKLEQAGPIVGIQLCTDDSVAKLVLTLARRPDGRHVGVLTVRIET